MAVAHEHRLEQPPDTGEELLKAHKGTECQSANNPNHLNPNPAPGIPTGNQEPNMRTKLTTSIQFGGPDGRTVINDDISGHVNPANTLPDNQRGNHHIQTNTSGFARYQQHEGAAKAGNATTQVQLAAKTGLVKIGGFEVTEDVAATLAEVAPGLTEDPSVKAAEAAKEADNAKDEEATREALNRHPDEIEGYHQHINGEVSQQSIISLMVYAQRGETPPASLISNIARDMGDTKTL
jgi:hypothetical protein